MKYQITDEIASLSLLDDAPIRQLFAQEMQRREAALLDAVLTRLYERGRILPGEELYREPAWHGADVVYSMPER